MRADQAGRAVGAVVVEVTTDLPVDDARAAVDDWLLDFPEVAEVAEFEVAQRDGLQAAFEQQAERVGLDGDVSVLLCASDVDQLGFGQGRLVCDVGPVADVSTLRQVLDVVAGSVEFAHPVLLEEDPAGVDEPEPEPEPEPDLGSEADSGPTAELLYVAVLGRAGWGRRRSADGRRQEFVDLVARHAPDRLIRLLALGDGIVGRTPLGLPADVASTKPGWTAKDWPGLRGRVALRRVVSDLIAQLGRDVEQARFEGVRVTRATCVLLVHEQLSGVSHFAEELRALERVVDLVWVAADRRVRRWPADLAATRLFGWHPEIADEVARALGMGERRLEERLAAHPR